jgi:hypothetical protein
MLDVREECPTCGARPGSACAQLEAGRVHLARRILSLCRAKPECVGDVIDDGDDA